MHDRLTLTTRHAMMLDMMICEIHLAQDLHTDHDELAILDAEIADLRDPDFDDDAAEVDRVCVAPSEDHQPYADALTAAGWTLTSAPSARVWTVARTLDA